MTRARAQRETSAGGVVYRMEHGTPLYLLIRDSYDNWGFPKGHLEPGERADEAAVREVREETGLSDLQLRGTIDTIDWYFRFRGRLIHKVCHFFLMETPEVETAPQAAEGITACQWVEYATAHTSVSYANARHVLRRAQELISGTAPADEMSGRTGQPSDVDDQLGLSLDDGPLR